MDTVFLHDYEVLCIIGVYDWERQVPQKLLISVEVEIDLAESGQSDNLDDTISYADLADAIQEIAVKGQYKLLEALGEELAHHILSHPHANSCHITINKPGAVRPAKACGVIIERP